MQDSSSDIPKYYRIAQDIITQIQSGVFKPGMPISSENVIISDYGVSNTTARKALHELEDQGWVARIKGKGTFVQEKKVRRSASRILSFTKNMLEEGRKPSTKVINIKKIKSSHSATISGRIYTIPGPLFALQRLRCGDNVPVMLETRYISARLCPGLDKKNMDQSLYDIYENEYGLHLSQIQQVLSVIELDDNRLKFFNLKKSVPAFKVEGASFCGKDIVLEIEESFYRGDQYQFTVTAF